MGLADAKHRVAGQIGLLDAYAVDERAVLGVAVGEQITVFVHLDDRVHSADCGVIQHDIVLGRTTDGHAAGFKGLLIAFVWALGDFEAVFLELELSLSAVEKDGASDVTHIDGNSGLEGFVQKASGPRSDYFVNSWVSRSRAAHICPRAKSRPRKSFESPRSRSPPECGACRRAARFDRRAPRGSSCRSPSASARAA